jgi:hypothetical protein
VVSEQKCDFLIKTLRLRAPATLIMFFHINTADPDFRPASTVAATQSTAYLASADNNGVIM